MAEAAAERLHNTPAIARNSYIHPDVISLAELDPADRAKRLRRLPGDDATTGYRCGERPLLAFLAG
jgi:DNA topoisomerase-1